MLAYIVVYEQINKHPCLSDFLKKFQLFYKGFFKHCAADPLLEHQARTYVLPIYTKFDSNRPTKIRANETILFFQI